MKLRPVLMMALKDHSTRTGMSQAQAGRRFGVTQPRVSDLMSGKISLFALDALVNMATAAGLRIELRVREAACPNRTPLGQVHPLGREEDVKPQSPILCCRCRHRQLRVDSI